MAIFLVIAGLTGALLAFNDELDAALNPPLFRTAPPTPDTQALDPLVLREQVQARFPGAWLHSIPLMLEPGRTTVFFLDSPVDPAIGKPVELPNNQVFVNPYTGEVQGVRRWGDITQGLKNLMPFVYRVHYSLTLDTPGSIFMGIVALLWTLDCFVGAYLTFPVKRQTRFAAQESTEKTWWARWRPAWQVRWRGGAHKLNFDLHRAKGLWLWAMLWVLAWSGVGFNLPSVYRVVMGTFFTLQAEDNRGTALPEAQPEPHISWFRAREIGRERMAAEARAKGFRVLEAQELSYDPQKAIYRYRVKSDRDIQDRGGATWIAFDANTGERRAAYIPTGEACGDTIGTWIMSLHVAGVFGRPMQLFVGGMGFAVTTLSITGTVIWWRKRRVRRARVRMWNGNTPPGGRSGDGTAA